MEKLDIEGGARHSGTMVPADNMNGALPMLAACLRELGACIERIAIEPVRV